MMKNHFLRRLLPLVCCTLLATASLVPALAVKALTKEELGYTPATELLKNGGTRYVFQDLSLAAYMRTEHKDLQNSDGSYSLAKLKNVDFISIWPTSPIDLSELQFFTNLESLCIYNPSELRGVPALTHCKKLNYLSFQNVGQVDVATLVKATPQVEMVSFGNCAQVDYEAITGWKKLSYVDLNGKSIVDLSYLSDIPLLHFLALGYLPNADFSSCHGVHGLDTLLLLDNSILQDPAAWALVAGNAKLETLQLGAEWLDGQYDFDAASLSNLKKLTKLEIAAAVIDDLSFLQVLRNLQTFALENCTLHSADFQPIARCKKLKELILTNTGVTELGFVKGMNLSLLWLNQNDIADISPLTKAKQIKKLSLSQNPVEDYAPLAKIKGLKFFQYDGTPTLPKLKGVETERGTLGWSFYSLSWENLLK